jgi:cobaltochelatase CobS
MLPKLVIDGPLAHYVPALDSHFDPTAWTARTRYTIQGRQCVRQHNISALAAALVNGHIIGLSGPPGAGKTTAIEYLAARCGWPLIKVQCHKDLDTDTFVGSWRFENGQTVFEYGPLAIAMQIGAILLLDEFCRAPAECLNTLQSVCEQAATRPLTIATHGGEVIVPHTNFRIVVADQTNGYGDDSGLHPDVRVQDAALLSRLNVRFHVEYPDPAAEVAILIAKTGLAPKQAEKLVQLATATREGQRRDEVAYAITMRHLLSCGEAARYVPLPEAFALTILAALPPGDADYVAALAQRIFGDDFVCLENI